MITSEWVLIGTEVFLILYPRSRWWQRIKRVRSPRYSYVVLPQ